MIEEKHGEIDEGTDVLPQTSHCDGGTSTGDESHDSTLQRVMLPHEDSCCIDMKKLEPDDPVLDNIMRALLESKTADRKVLRSSRLYTLVDDILHFKLYTSWQAKNVLALPQALVGDVLKSFHDSLTSGAHSGIAKTYHKIREKYY